MCAFQTIQVKSILNKKRRRDSWFLDDYTINPYSGCSFNCLYCYVRGSKYGGQMESKLSLKSGAVELLGSQLKKRALKGQYGIIVLSSATDPYVHIEEQTQLTRSILEVILKYRFPVHVLTKSDLVLRDLDILQSINRNAVLPADLEKILPGRALITFSFSTIDNNIASVFEPGAAPPDKRLAALKIVSDKGFIAGVSMMPLLPYVSDNGAQLIQMLNSFKEAHAHYVMPASLSLFGNNSSDSRQLIYRAIDKHYPQLSEKYRTFFNNSICMPFYYTKSLEKKIAELSALYGLRNSIIPFPA